MALTIMQYVSKRMGQAMMDVQRINTQHMLHMFGSDADCSICKQEQALIVRNRAALRGWRD